MDAETQERLYRETMGTESANRQADLASRIQTGSCTCEITPGTWTKGQPHKLGCPYGNPPKRPAR